MSPGYNFCPLAINIRKSLQKLNKSLTSTALKEFRVTELVFAFFPTELKSKKFKE